MSTNPKDILADALRRAASANDYESMGNMAMRIAALENPQDPAPPGPCLTAQPKYHLPSRHQINDRVSLKLGQAYGTATVIGVTFAEGKVFYDLLNDAGVRLERVEWRMVLDPVTGDTDDLSATG